MNTNYVELREEIKEKQNKLKEEMRELGENFFKEYSKKIFEDFPIVREFGWTQYTPFFMDGDPCVFGVNDALIYFEGDETNPDDDLYGEDGYYYISPYNKPEVEYTEKDRAYKAVCSVVHGVDDDVFQSMFGDHVKIRVTKDKIEIEDYDHE